MENSCHIHAPATLILAEKASAAHWVDPRDGLDTATAGIEIWPSSHKPVTMLITVSRRAKNKKKRYVDECKSINDPRSS
jgi:hypothetical protein